MRIYFVFRVFSLAFPLKCLGSVFECLVFLIFICYFNRKENKVLNIRNMCLCFGKQVGWKVFIDDKHLIDDKTR